MAAAREQVSCDLAAEAAILQLTTGVYYGLDPVGARIWRLVQQPRTLAALRDAILGEYDVEPERCERDLHAFLADLVAAGLVEVSDAPFR